MPAAARTTDPVSTGHGCDGTTTADTHASSVYIEGLLAHREEDLTSSHTLPSGDSCVAHTVALDAGSPNVFVEGKALGRVGDTYGSHAITGGASNVFVNDPFPGIETAYPKATKMLMDDWDILEMIATLILGSKVYADPIDHLSEEDFKSIFVERDKSKYLSTAEYEKAIDEVAKGLSQTAEDLHTFRGQMGYSAQGKELSHDAFMDLYGDDLREYAKLKHEADALRTSVIQKLVDEKTGETYDKYVWADKPGSAVRIRKIERIMQDIEAILIENISHHEMAGVLWKESSVVTDRPVIIERIHDLYADDVFDSISGEEYLINRSKPLEPPKPAGTYSATVVDIDKIDRTSAQPLGARVKQYWILPAGTRVIHTVGLADNLEILVSGRDLLNTKLLYSGSILQDIKINLDSNNLTHIDDELFDQLELEFKERNPGKPIPKWWVSLKANIPEIKAALEAEGGSRFRNWKLNMFLVILTGATHAIIDNDDAYWDIWQADGFRDYQDKLTAYYGSSTYEITKAADFHERLNQIAIASTLQVVDIAFTGVGATVGAGMRELWKQQDRAWMWLMENISEFEDALDELLLPPDDWN